jgi:monofunctional biosynthetic peptidoglycan transglycosylase
MLQTYFSQRPRQPYSYRWVSYGNISPYVALAAIASEDQRFPEHHGFDLEELEQAIEAYQRGEDLRGASTISQQVAKNLYLWPGRSMWRKVPEAGLTVMIEWLWTKQRILEVYLNIAQFDDSVFGVEAASQRFFGVSASNLTPDEAAALVAVLPAPALYEVSPPSPEVVQRQFWILQQMQQLGGLEYLQRLDPELGQQ